MDESDSNQNQPRAGSYHEPGTYLAHGYEEFARAILFGDTLQDKLISLSPTAADPLHTALIDPPRFPGRPPQLARLGKAEFPAIESLNQSSTARGQVLHFFANHELLAMELMALVLLKFPDAPTAFRSGIARTISEEQSHMRLYMKRMQELSVGFGDLPLSDYFWNAMKGMNSPLQFVTQMSLTLEQANLDFSLFFKQAMERAGDLTTASILETVYREEIGHVKHGLSWFNRWRDPAEGDDWDAYLKLLPPPMTPRRAKGVTYEIAPRLEAGLSERFVHELEIFGGSKGRPPVFWHYNPLCDAEIARGKPGHTPTEPVRRLTLDLEPLLMHLATSQDTVLARELPRVEWLKSLSDLNWGIPEFRLQGRPGETPREQKLGGVEPWGWSPDSFGFFKHFRDKIVSMPNGNGDWAAGFLDAPSFSATGLGEFFSKSWSARFLAQWLEEHAGDRAVFGSPSIAGRSYGDWESARKKTQEAFESSGKNPPENPGLPLLLAKAPWGTSGTQNKRILAESEISEAGAIGKWIQGTIASQGAILLEPWLDKIADLSMQIEVGPKGTKTLGIRRFYVGSRLEYRGTELDPRLTSLGTECLRFLHSPPSSDGVQPLESWKRLARAVGQKLSDAGYQGPAGLDAMIWREPSSGELRLKPLVELNPRWTMGRVALAIEEQVVPGTPARWVFISKREIGAKSFEEWARELGARYPVERESAGGRMRISEGVIFTTDPERAREVLTVLAVGARVCEDAALSRG